MSPMQTSKKSSSLQEKLQALNEKYASSDEEDIDRQNDTSPALSAVQSWHENYQENGGERFHIPRENNMLKFGKATK